MAEDAEFLNSSQLCRGLHFLLKHHHQLRTTVLKHTNLWGIVHTQTIMIPFTFSLPLSYSELSFKAGGLCFIN